MQASCEQDKRFSNRSKFARSKRFPVVLFRWWMQLEGAHIVAQCVFSLFYALVIHTIMENNNLTFYDGFMMVNYRSTEEYRNNNNQRGFDIFSTRHDLLNSGFFVMVVLFSTFHQKVFV